ncbi:MAG TPA: AraD1 family protein [Roseiflexaceae bacterium]|nr:AraD1 family protein [Roseiflexaceae bacterium]
MIRLVQLFDEAGARRVALSSDEAGVLRLIDGYARVYDLVLAAIRADESLEAFVYAHLSRERADYDLAVAEQRLLPPIDHPDPARCVVSLTGLTHLGCATSRDQMHAALAAGNATDTMRMFQIGLEGGKPAAGRIGAQPEWAYKGDGRCVVAPEQALTQPAFADDGGEEAEIAGLYVIADDGSPWRVGFALGNEFADHVLERKNYLYLAHSKLRECSFGPELLVGELPEALRGEVRVRRGDEVIWSSPFETGEAHMCHAIANLEHHHFKYNLFRRPGDLHVHFFGANGVSFGAGVQTRDGDRFEIDQPLFGRPLRNTLRVAPDAGLVRVRAL